MSGRWPVAKKTETEPTQKTCFVVTQIGEKGSPERIHADWVFDEILSPLFERKYKDFKLVRADKISKPGLIDAQIIGYLASSELVVADLTNLNPNVFYEIGIRHAARKPIIHMHEENQKIPFDVTLFRSLPFSLREPSELRAARSSLEELIDAVLAPDFEIDNPVTRAIDKIGLERTATPAEQILSRQVESLALRISEIEKVKGGQISVLPSKNLESESEKGKIKAALKIHRVNGDAIDNNDIDDILIYLSKFLYVNNPIIRKDDKSLILYIKENPSAVEMNALRSVLERNGFVVNLGYL